MRVGDERRDVAVAEAGDMAFPVRRVLLGLGEDEGEVPYRRILTSVSR